MNGFTPEQLSQLKQAVREAVQEELADAGLRLDGASHQDQAREDFRFLRRLRQGVDGTASKIGWLVILALFGGVSWLVTTGLNAWRGG